MLENEINIIKDVNLIHPEVGVDIATTLKITKMTAENYKELCSLDVRDFDQCYRCYRCDICNISISEENPIYTKMNEEGVDVCEKCLKRTVETYGSLPVYNLKNILICERNQLKDESDEEPKYDSKRDLYYFHVRLPSLSKYKGIENSIDQVKN